MADCSNNSMNKSLIWKALVEILNGDMAYILEFLYIFWQLIDYYNSTYKFNHRIWKNSISLEVTWYIGYLFKFIIWTEHDWCCKNVQEPTYNIIRQQKMPQ